MKYEYLIKQFSLMRPTSAHQDTLNELGQEGWELVSCSGDTSSLITVLKREITDRHPAGEKVVVKTSTGKILGRQG